MNTINTNISFGAKLDYKNIKGNKARWAKVAQVFEEKTKKQPKDILHLETNSEGGIYFAPQYSNKKLAKATQTYNKGELSLNATNTLATYSSEKVANVFKKLFSIRKKADTMLLDYSNMEKKYKLTETCNYKIIDNFYLKFGDVRKSFAKNKVNEDNVLNKLKDVEII